MRFLPWYVVFDRYALRKLYWKTNTQVRILLTTQHVKKAIEKSAWLNVAVLEFIKRGANHLDISLNNFKGEEDAETQIIIQHLVEDFCSILQVGTFDPTKWTLATRHAVWYVVFKREIVKCIILSYHKKIIEIF